MLIGPEIKPSNGNQAKYLVVLLHGLGADGKNLIDVAEVMSQYLSDAHFIAPNAPFAYDMGIGGYQWFSRHERTEIAALEGLKKATPILGEFINYKLEALSLSEKDLIIVGFSQGTMVALHHFLRIDNPIKLIVGFSGALVAPELLYSELRSKPPVLLIHGKNDTVLPIEGMYAAYRALKEHNIDVQECAYSNLGHSINQAGLMLAIENIKKYL